MTEILTAYRSFVDTDMTVTSYVVRTTSTFTSVAIQFDTTNTERSTSISVVTETSTFSTSLQTTVTATSVSVSFTTTTTNEALAKRLQHAGSTGLESPRATSIGNENKTLDSRDKIVVSGNKPSWATACKNVQAVSVPDIMACHRGVAIELPTTNDKCVNTADILPSLQSHASVAASKPAKTLQLQSRGRATL